MKKLIWLVCLLVSFNLFSQSLFNTYEEGTVYFKDGTQTKGLLKISGFTKDEIKFKKTRQDKKQLLNYKKVKKIEFLSGDEYFYKIINKKRKIILIKREIKGTLNLFSYTVQRGGMPGGGAGFPGGGVSIGFSFGGGSSTVYYLGAEDTDFIDQLPRNSRGKQFWRIMSKYTSNCKVLSDKIKNKNSIKKNFRSKKTAVVDMVTFFNENCN